MHYAPAHVSEQQTVIASTMGNMLADEKTIDPFSVNFHPSKEPTQPPPRHNVELMALIGSNAHDPHHHRPDDMTTEYTHMATDMEVESEGTIRAFSTTTNPLQT